ncbi:MAG: hypothetical protein WC782_16660 [Methylococcaceae bacterium]|jgi:DNA-binding CsgD family transcriptional regulator
MAYFDEQAIINNKRFSQWATGLSALLFALISFDISSDYSEGVQSLHLLVELLIGCIALCGMVYFGRLYYRLAQTKISLLKHDLALANQQAQQWRLANHQLLAGLAVQIQKQFDVWLLTPAEAEIGLLMLKGLSHVQIAHLRQTSERTIRDQARAVYRKAGLSGRTELSAFFLEDLLLPR